MTWREAFESPPEQEGTPNPVREHVCSMGGEVARASAGARSPNPRPGGAAVDRVVGLDGAWWAVGGPQGLEYSTPIRYCPFCGFRLGSSAR